MRKKSLLKTITSLAVTTSLVLSVGVSAIAADAIVGYQQGSRGYDIYGVPDVRTTFSGSGYATVLQVGGSNNTVNPTYDTDYTYDGIRVRVSPSLNSLGNAVLVTYTVTNTTSSAQEIKLGSYADTQVGDEDYAAVSADANGITMSANGKNFYLVPGSGNFTTQWAGNYSLTSDRVFSDSRSYPNGYEPDDGMSRSGDSGLAFSWTINIGANETVTESVVFTIGETLDRYTLTLNSNDGTGAIVSRGYLSGIGAPIPNNTFTRDGYSFIGWSDDPDATSATYVSGDEITLTADMTLYAIWQENAPAPQPNSEPDSTPTPVPAPAAPSSAPAGPTPEQIRAQLISNFVERLYIVALDRSYDVVGRDYWVDQLMNQGNSGSYVAKGFFHSQEFLARDLSDEEFVTVLYSVFFDRTPDAEGFANWTNALANGATRDQVIAGFAGSPEWAATCARFEVNI